MLARDRDINFRARMPAGRRHISARAPAIFARKNLEAGVCVQALG
jgi:hypothetical protein